MEHGLIEKHTQKAIEWINEVKDLGGWQNQEIGLAALRAVLHQLRDNVSIAEAVHFSAQLPLLVRGLFFEGWKPSQTPLRQNAEAFLESIRRNILQWPDLDAEIAAKCVFQTLVNHINAGNIRKLRDFLPSDISALFDQVKKGSFKKYV